MPRVAKPKPRCIECGRLTMRTHGILGVSLCADCRKGHPDKYGCVTKTRAMREYRLKEADLAPLPFIELPNPYHKTGKSMYLYLHRQIRDITRNRYGGDEPYVVQLVPFSQAQLDWFAGDSERTKGMSPRSFERLVADRLDAMGLQVRIVGDVYQKDGGIDIVAFPKPERIAFPFLVGVQVKHHSVAVNTGSADVRDLLGAISSRGIRFNAGLLVTNTSFTADARWFAENQPVILRLRDLRDLQRWLRNDFVNESEWREIPERLVLAPGVEIVIPRPKIR